MADNIKNGKPLYAGLLSVKSDLKAPKDADNDFGGYKYRSAEGILAAVKPLLAEQQLDLFLDDEIVNIGGFNYIKATATVIDIITGDSVSTHAYAKEIIEKKKSDACQLTGTASSYARKYAMCGMFAIDDTKDSDSNEYQIEQKAKELQDVIDNQLINTSSAKGQENLKNNVIQQIFNKAKSRKVDNEIVKEMIHYLGYNSSKDMTVNQLIDLVNDFDKILNKVQENK